MHTNSIQYRLFGLGQLGGLRTFYSIIYSIILVPLQSEQVELSCYHAVSNKVCEHLWTGMSRFERKQFQTQFNEK